MDIFLIILAVLIILITAIILLPVSLSVKIKWDKKLEREIKLFGKVLEFDSSKTKGNNVGFTQTLNFIFSKESGIWSDIKYIFSKAVINKFKLHITVAGDDAAATALTYSGVCALLYPAVAYLESIITFKEDDLKILCDYEGENPNIYLFVKIRVSLKTALFTVIKLIPKIKKLTKEVKENEQNS